MNMRKIGHVFLPSRFRAKHHRAVVDHGFEEEFQEFRRLMSGTAERFSLRWEDRFPCLEDRTAHTEFDRHYVYHPAWAARVLARTRPEVHIDISSTLYFCSIVSAFVPVRFFDYRRAEIRLGNLSSDVADLMSLPFADTSVKSISCMHVVEHVGLGRYGDALDPDGDLKSISELKRVLAYGGDLLFVVPVGKPKILFNAHRIYSYEQITNYFSELELVEFALIPDDPNTGGLLYNAREELADAQVYGCGCFWFRRVS